MELERPDGARIHYEVRGDGPLVVLVLAVGVVPSVYDGLAADLARDHRVVTWDARGCGGSSLQAPFTVTQDADDLTALIAHVGGPAALFAAGQGVTVAANAAARSPDLVRGVVAHGVSTGLSGDLEDAEGPAASSSVLDMLFEQFRRDPRASARALLASLNPQLSEAELRARIDATIAYMDLDAAVERLASWRDQGSVRAELQTLGDRLIVLEHESDEWAAGTSDRVAALLPDARRRLVEDGPLSRPDLSAALVRELP